MPETDSTNLILLAASRVLIRCFVMGLLILLFWGGIILLAGNQVYVIHSSLFMISQQQFYGINYCLLALTKVFVFLFFLVPYVAIKLVLKKS